MITNISVIIRTLGRPSLRRAIESVELQGRSDVEIVVVAARPNVQPVGSTRCEVRWVPTETPLHRCASANAGLDAAQGQYLIFLDDDDWFEAGHLDKLVAALEKTPDAVLAHTGIRSISDTGEPQAEFDASFEPWQLVTGPRFPIHAALIRRSAIAAGRCRFDLQLDVYEDWDFWLQLLKVGPFVHVPGISAVYLVSDAGSGVQSIAYGAEPYRRLWRKWCGSYDVSWLAAIFDELPRREHELGRKQGEIAQLNAQLQARRDEIRQLNAELHAARTELAAERIELGAERTELAVARQSEQRLSARLENATANYNAILNSHSWKVTAGFRSLSRGLRYLASWLRKQPDPVTGSAAAAADGYAEWIVRHDTVTGQHRQAIQNEIKAWTSSPLISIVMPVYNPPLQFLREALDSVLAQIYPHWELCVADDASTNPEVKQLLADYADRDVRIRVVYRAENGHIVAASNSALAIATGEFVALLDHDDLLPVHALYEVARVIRARPDAGAIYSDEDKFDGRRFDPYFKPDFNYELLLGQNLLSHLGAYRRSLLQEIGGFRAGMEGSQDHDLALRCIERLEPSQVVHIPKVLYHWRLHSGSTAISAAEKPYVLPAGVRAVNDHLARVSPGASADPNPEASMYYRVRFALPDPAPKVSIIIPTRNAYRLLSVCLNTLFQLTRYPSYEVMVIDNGSDESALLNYLSALAGAGKITVLRDDGPFNFSALNNRAVEQCSGEFVLLLNNDIEIIEPGWLAEMVAVAARPGVGAVGARLWYPNRTVQHAGVIGGLGGVAGHAHCGMASDNPGYFGRAVLLQSFSAVTAACLLVRRAIYKEVGGLDEENLTVAFNDVDFCWRIMQAGYRNLWTPFAQLVHHESATRGKDLAPEKAKRFESEVRFMERKWGLLLGQDPAYNVNLSLNDPMFALAAEPRQPVEHRDTERRPR